MNAAAMLPNAATTLNFYNRMPLPEALAGASSQMDMELSLPIRFSYGIGLSFDVEKMQEIY